MTVLIISREAFSKNIKIGVIKSLKLTAFKCKNNLTKILSYRSTFKNEFDPSSNLLLLEYIPSGKSNCGLRNQQLTLCAHLQILFVDKQQFSGRFWGISLGLLVTSSPKLLHFDQMSEYLTLVWYRVVVCIMYMHFIYGITPKDALNVNMPQWP